MTGAKRKQALKTALLVIASFVAGAASQLMRPQSPATWVKHEVEEAAATKVIQEDRAKEWQGGLDNLGIRQGDIILSVNGVKDTTMMQELVTSVNEGRTCVVYERDSVVREVCLERKAPKK